MVIRNPNAFSDFNVLLVNLEEWDRQRSNLTWYVKHPYITEFSLAVCRLNILATYFVNTNDSFRYGIDIKTIKTFQFYYIFIIILCAFIINYNDQEKLKKVHFFYWVTHALLHATDSDE